MTAQVIRLLFLAIGVVALGAGLRQTLANVYLLRVGETAPGRVTGPGHPMVTFTTASGQLIKYQQNGYKSERGRGTVDVLFDPAAPAETAVLKIFWTMWLPVLQDFILGLPLLGFALGSFFI